MTIKELNEGIISRLASKLKGGIEIILDVKKISNVKIDSDTVCNITFKIDDELIFGCKNIINKKEEHSYNFMFDKFFKKLGIDIGELLIDRGINYIKAIKFVKLHPLFTTNDGLRSSLNPLQKIQLIGYVIDDNNNERKNDKAILDIKFIKDNDKEAEIVYNFELKMSDYKRIIIKNKSAKIKIKLALDF